MTHMNTLSQVMNDLRIKGFTDDFEMTDEGLCCKVSGAKYSPDELSIVEVFRFEGSSNPDDMSVLYAILADSDGTKGLFVDAYGTYSSYDPQKAVKYLKEIKRKT